MIFTDRAIILLLLSAIVLAIGFVGPVVKLGGAELGRTALLAAALIDALAALLVLVDRLALGRAARSAKEITVRRTTEEIVSQGRPNTARLVIENQTRRPVRLEIRDSLPPSFIVEPRSSVGAPRSSAGEVQHATTGGSSGSSTSSANLTTIAAAGLPLRATVPPESRLELSYQFTPTVRGQFTIGDLYVRRHGPLGLLMRQEIRPASRPVQVYPDIYAVARSRTLATRAGRQGLGLRRTRVLGEGREFHRLRPYVQGDDIRLIDWKATARHHHPETREFELERNQRLMIALDAGRLMTAEAAGLTKFDWAVAAAMGLANVACASGDQVGLLIFSKEVKAYLPPRKGAGQFRRLVDTLALAEADLFEPDYDYALRHLAAHQSRRSLIVLLTDLAVGAESPVVVSRLAGLIPRHLPVCATISDPRLAAVASAAPRESFDAYRVAAAQEVIHDLATMRQVLTSRGVITVDLEAGRLLAGLLDHYLDIKARGRL